MNNRKREGILNFFPFRFLKKLNHISLNIGIKIDVNVFKSSKDDKIKNNRCKNPHFESTQLDRNLFS